MRAFLGICGVGWENRRRSSQRQCCLRVRSNVILVFKTSYVLCLDAKRALTAEDVRAQEFIAEFAVGVELFA
jgi:hypothetical protein